MGGGPLCEGTDTREVTLSCPHCGDHTVTELQEPVARR